MKKLLNPLNRLYVFCRIILFKQVIRILPDYTFAHYSLGMIYLVQGDKNAALDEYKILKDLDQDTADKLFDMIYK